MSDLDLTLKEAIKQAVKNTLPNWNKARLVPVMYGKCMIFGPIILMSLGFMYELMAAGSKNETSDFISQICMLLGIVTSIFIPFGILLSIRQNF